MPLNAQKGWRDFKRNYGENAMKFCKACGMPLDKRLNKRFEGPDVKGREFCNQKCKARFERMKRPRRARKNHGVIGW